MGALLVGYLVEPAAAEVVIDGSTRLTWQVSGAEFSARDGAFALLAALPKAMSERRPLHVRGRVDTKIIRNAELVSHYWAQWRPASYVPVEITADEVCDGSDNAGTVTAKGIGPRPGRYAMCLSGGIDSSYAYLSTTAAKQPHLRFNVPLAVFVQGFDFRLKDEEAYRNVLASVKQIVDPAETEVASVVTNWKQELCDRSNADWEHVHVLGLASVLHLFGGSSLTGGIFASDYNFTEDHVIAPWGSNAAINRMVGSRDFEILCVGETASRQQKIMTVDEHGKLPFVNVCFDGARKTGRNCARCFKCRRYMLMFQALGIDPRPTFGSKLTPRDLLTTPVGGHYRSIRRCLDIPDNHLTRDMRRAAELTILKERARLLLARGANALGL